MTYVGVLPATGWSQMVKSNIGYEHNGEFVPHRWKAPLVGFAVSAEGHVLPMCINFDDKRRPYVEIAKHWGVFEIVEPGEDY